MDEPKVVNRRFTNFSLSGMKSNQDDLTDKDCYYFPRGRVVADDTNFKFLILANKKMDTMKIRTKIKNYCNLSEKNIVWNFENKHYN